MKKIQRIVQGELASLLILMMLALCGLTAGKVITNGDVAALLSAAVVNPQNVATSNTAPITTDLGTQSTSTGPAAQTSAVQQAQQPKQGGVVDARPAVRQAGPAVVTVINTLQQQATTGRGRFGGPGQGLPSEATGTGVIIDAQGYIITNQHVVDGQQSLQVVFADGTKTSATLVGQDAYTDIAVIKVAAKVPAVAQFGDSNTLEAGQPVVAIGSALGDYVNTVTEGIISGLHRTITDSGMTVSASLRDLIQTDAAINHGNSGGPLLDLSGNIVGINTAVVRTGTSAGDVAEGLGFSIPGNTAKTIADQLIKGGSVSHPYIGISYQTITPELAQANNLSVQQGIYVSDVASDSPAQKAGIQPNSVITSFDGTALTNSTDLANLLSKHKVGDQVKLAMIAPNTTAAKDVTITLAARPSGQ